MEDHVSPSLRISKLHIRGLGPIAKLNLPEDGLDWSGIPDAMVIGGVNGSGKTTLLTFIARVAHLLAEQPAAIPDEVQVDEALVDFELVTEDTGPVTLRFLLGDKDFVDKNSADHVFGYRTTGKRPSPLLKGAARRVHEIIENRERFAKSNFPSILLVPANPRMLQIPTERFKQPGRLAAPDDFVHEWFPAQKWNESFEALLYDARWRDLNAKEEGRPAEAHRFSDFAQAFDQLSSGRKHLVWRTNEPKVEVTLQSGDVTAHGLDMLSSGEQQVLLLSAEVLYRWRPGSLILIDEPELHLHRSWQLWLWEFLLKQRAERGGQLIVATQSNDLFRASPEGSNLLLTPEAL